MVLSKFPEPGRAPLLAEPARRSQTEQLSLFDPPTRPRSSG
jgi:hypothetical protein